MAKFGENAALAEEALAGPWSAVSGSRFALTASGGLVGGAADGQRCCSAPTPP